MGMHWTTRTLKRACCRAPPLPFCPRRANSSELSDTNTKDEFDLFAIDIASSRPCAFAIARASLCCLFCSPESHPTARSKRPAQQARKQAHDRETTGVPSRPPRLAHGGPYETQRESTTWSWISRMTETTQIDVKSIVRFLVQRRVQRWRKAARQRAQREGTEEQPFHRVRLVLPFPLVLIARLTGACPSLVAGRPRGVVHRGVAEQSKSRAEQRN